MVFKCDSQVKKQKQESEAQSGLDALVTVATPPPPSSFSIVIINSSRQETTPDGRQHQRPADVQFFKAFINEI